MQGIIKSSNILIQIIKCIFKLSFLKYQNYISVLTFYPPRVQNSDGKSMEQHKEHIMEFQLCTVLLA